MRVLYLEGGEYRGGGGECGEGGGYWETYIHRNYIHIDGRRGMNLQHEHKQLVYYIYNILNYW